MAQFFSAGDIAGTAVEIERRGRNVYAQAARTAANPEVKRFWEFLAGEEARHQSLFEDMVKRIGPAPLPPGSDPAEYMGYVQILLDSHALFCGDAPERMLADAADTLTAVELAMRFEKDTILYFSEMAKFLPVAESGVVKLCLEEERGHLRQLLNMVKTLK